MFDLSGAHRVEVMERNEAIPAAEKPHFSKIARSGAPYQAVASIRALQMWATRPIVKPGANLSPRFHSDSQSFGGSISTEGAPPFCCSTMS